MLFLDQNLSVRDAIAYQDLQIVKAKGKQYQTLTKMSETDLFASIYTDPLRLRIFRELASGPQVEEDLIELLKQNPDFIEEEFNLIMLPLIRTGLVKTKWLQDTFQMCYFLVQDFIVYRSPSVIIKNIFLKEDNFKPYSDVYFEKLNAALLNYKKRLTSGVDAQIEEFRLCLEIRSQLKYLNIFNPLRDGPQTLEELSDVADIQLLEELIEKGFITEIMTKSETYYTLLTDIRIKKFTPKYLTDIIAQQINTTQISREMALDHLDFLFDSEVTH